MIEIKLDEEYNNVYNSLDLKSKINKDLYNELVKFLFEPIDYITKANIDLAVARILSPYLIKKEIIDYAISVLFPSETHIVTVLIKYQENSDYEVVRIVVDNQLNISGL